jgi:hypothetical protein
MGWEALHQRLVTHLGIRESEAELYAELARLEASLRAEAAAGLSSIGEAAARTVLQGSESHLLVETACEARSEDSRARRFRPPPERAFLCSPLAELARGGVEAQLRATIILHDGVALASWAMAIHEGGVDPDEAPHGRGLLSDVPPERMGGLVRFAAVRPAQCIALARMASLLEGAGPSERRARASRWLDYGDAPLDLVARDLGWR